jgi:ABC-type uncharacterized transport system substrate-binding protein
MKRRDLIRLVGGAATWPLAARAQQQRQTFRIGIVTGGSREAPHIVALFDELRLAGFIEGTNLTADIRGGGLSNDQLPAAISEIVRSAPNAIVSVGPTLTKLVQQATRTIPILASSDDMLSDGLVTSMARPGGNTTGVSLLAYEMDGKRQEILLEMVPSARHIAALADPHVATPQHLESLKTAMRQRSGELSVFLAGATETIVPALGEVKSSGAAALNVLATPLFYFNRRLVIDRAEALGLPAIYQWPEMVEEGGLTAYGPRASEWYRQLARLLIKVLRGATPADLPVEQPTKFEFIINLRAAKAIGLNVPNALLLRADKIVE